MGKPISFKILLAKQPPVFFSNQSISGTVVIKLRRALQVNSVQARIYGRAYTKVDISERSSVDDGSDVSNSGQNTPTELFTEEEKYLDHCITLYSKEIGDVNTKDTLLPAGVHQYHFNFLLPSDAKMPTSFEHGPNCNIRYEIKATIDRDGNGTNYTSTKTFTVLEWIDINQPSLTKRPYPQQDEAIFPRWCHCSSGSIKLTACIDRSSCCPGEGIIFNAKCENLSSKTMDCLKIRLFRYVTWIAQGHKQRAIKCYYEHESRSKISPGHLFDWKDEYIHIPSVPPTIKSCSIISVTYEIVVFGFCDTETSVLVSLPFIVGTIPFKCYNRRKPNLQRLPSIPGTVSAVAPSSELSSIHAIPALQMANFRECVDAINEPPFESEDKNSEFVPLYTFSTNYNLEWKRII